MLMNQIEADDASDSHSADAGGPQPAAASVPRSGGPRRDGPAAPAGLPMDIGILVTIRALLPNLAPVERRVAQAVLDDPSGAARRSISELSRSCGTSATTVVRFCRAVGLRGYPELRLALAAAVAHGG